MSKYIWLLDAGHGGVIAGNYQTQGKRSPTWEDDTVLYEGEFNRAIVNRLAELCSMADINYVLVSPKQEDKSLKERSQFVNHWDEAYTNCILVSVHANAGGGKGFEVFTSPGQTFSDNIATVFYEEFGKAFPEVRLRKDFSDGDSDKEAAFYILTKTNCPAILCESFFMDNEEECKKYLMTIEGRDRIADAYFNAIARIEREGV